MVDTLKRSAYVVLLIAIQCTAIGRAEVRPAFPAFPSMESVFILTSAKSHSISPENPTGEKGQGGKADLNTGSAGHAAKDLGVGWKVNPNVNVAPGSTFTLAQFKGEGIVNHIWMTLGGKAQYRSAILRMYWHVAEPRRAQPRLVGRGRGQVLCRWRYVQSNDQWYRRRGLFPRVLFIFETGRKPSQRRPQAQRGEFLIPLFRFLFRDAVRRDKSGLLRLSGAAHRRVPMAHCRSDPFRS
jgi:hypothetical protein